MTSSIIRLARPDEAAILSDLALRSKGHWGYSTDFLASCKEELLYTPSQLLSLICCFNVAQIKNHHIVGFFGLNFLGDEQVELEALFVEPEFIGQGWGKKLLNSAVEVAKVHQAKKIKIQSDPFAENFYLANGAVKIGELGSHSIPGRFLPLLEINL